MKIGIVTQPLLRNYGGVLQNFALQHTLRKLGHEPITFNYIPMMSRGRFVKVWIRNFIYNLFHATKRPLPQNRIRIERHPHFARFINDHIAVTEQIERYSSKLVSKYRLDAVLAGSDQVWRPCYNRKVLTNMFLDFVKGVGDVKRVAYAASFGVDYWEYKPRKARKCSSLARTMDAVSVRENSGVALCRDNLSVEAIEVLDPTLLLDAEDYKQLCDSIPCSEERYIAAYILDATPEKVAFVEREAVRRGLSYRIYGAGNDVELTVEEWLATLRDAEYIVTDSFHGSIFSIIFRKEFSVIINRDRGASRFVSLLGKFNLLNRTIIDAKRGEVLTEPIDWQTVDVSLQSWRERSVKFLKQALCR